MEEVKPKRKLRGCVLLNNNTLTDKNKKDIKRLFYRGLRKGETIVDNTPLFISKELNIPIRSVKYFISKKL